MEKAKSCVTFCRPRRLAAILAGALLLGSADTLAEERRNFLGETITVEPGRFFVTADVNVRAKPTANSEKVGRFGKGEKIQVVGRLDKQWYALEKDGQDLGFVYAPVLIPLIDGGLDKARRPGGRAESIALRIHRSLRGAEQIRPRCRSRCQLRGDGYRASVATGW